MGKDKEKDYKFSEQVARDQLEIFIDFYEISDKDLTSMERTTEKMVEHIRKARVDIKMDGDELKVKQTLKSGTMLNYSELRGRHKIAMKKKEELDIHGRMYALMGAICGDGERAIQELKGVDLSVVECLGGLFLLV